MTTTTERFFFSLCMQQIVLIYYVFVYSAQLFMTKSCSSAFLKQLLKWIHLCAGTGVTYILFSNIKHTLLHMHVLYYGFILRRAGLCTEKIYLNSTKCNATHFTELALFFTEDDGMGVLYDIFIITACVSLKFIRCCLWLWKQTACLLLMWVIDVCGVPVCNCAVRCLCLWSSHYMKPLHRESLLVNVSLIKWIWLKCVPSDGFYP